MAGFMNQGQVCAACSRIYVEEPLFDRVAAGLQQALSGMSIGPGMDENALINPVVSSQHQKKIQSFLDGATEAGAEMLQGPAAPSEQGFYVRPTLVINPDDSLPLARDEVFGPVMTLTRVKNAEEALSKANDTPFGLAASLWTGSLDAAMRLPPKMEAGTVWVNSHVMIDRSNDRCRPRSDLLKAVRRYCSVPTTILV